MTTATSSTPVTITVTPAQPAAATVSAPSAPAPATSGFSKFFDVVQPFIIGGTSGMFATCIIQPIDMIKVSIQLKSEEQVNHKAKINPFAVAGEIFKAEGIRGFYRGYPYALYHIDLTLLLLGRSSTPQPDWVSIKHSSTIPNSRIRLSAEVYNHHQYRGSKLLPESLYRLDCWVCWLSGWEPCRSGSREDASWL